jgi:hypothetical protein
MAHDIGHDIVNTCPAFQSIIPIQLAARGNAMSNKKIFSAVILAAVAVSSTAMAQDRGANTVVGALIGAAIGHHTGGRDGAIVGGVLGAAVGNAVTPSNRNDGFYDNRGYSDNRVEYYDNRASSSYSPPVTTTTTYYDNGSSYYQPAPVYVAPAPVYYAPAPRYYYQPSAVVVVESGRGYYGGHHGGHYGGHHGR